MESVRKLLSLLLYGRCDEAHNSCIVTVNRGYGKELFMQLLSYFGVASVFVMSDQLLRVHTFVCLTFFNPNRADDQDLATIAGDNGGV